MLRFEFVISASASEPISMQPLLDETSTEGKFFFINLMKMKILKNIN